MSRLGKAGYNAWDTVGSAVTGSGTKAESTRSEVENSQAETLEGAREKVANGESVEGE